MSYMYFTKLHLLANMVKMSLALLLYLIFIYLSFFHFSRELLLPFFSHLRVIMLNSSNSIKSLKYYFFQLAFSFVV